jgi:hypothetical protein
MMIKTAHSAFKKSKKDASFVSEEEFEALQSNGGDDNRNDVYVVRSLAEVNSGWRILGAVGGMIHKVIDSFGVQFEAPAEDAGISTIDDL